MPKVHHIKKARKAFPESGIAVGDSYYQWAFRFGGVRRSKTYPKPSQLTNSEFLSTVYSLSERIGEMTVEAIAPSDDLAALKEAIQEQKDDLKSEVDDIVSELEDLKSETEDKLSNMPEGLQQGTTGELLQNRVDELDNMISELEGINWDDEDQNLEDLLADIQNVSYNGE